MDLGIRGRAAIVAGGSAGMGKASARSLAAEGVELVVSARGEERLRETVAAIARDFGVPVTAVVADHGTAEGRARLLEACPEPDILITSSSPAAMVSDFTDVVEQDWMDAMFAPLIGPIELMRATIPGMAARRFGRIVNIGTAAAKSPMLGRLLSGPPRSALANYTVAVSKVVAKDNVTINNILPGLYRSDAMVDRLEQLVKANDSTEEQETARLLRKFRVPAGRFGECDDLGDFVAMFCSRQANFTTGQSLVMDGGSVNALM